MGRQIVVVKDKTMSLTCMLTCHAGCYVSIRYYPPVFFHTQEDEAGPAGDPPQGSQELLPAVQREDVCPLPEAAGQVVELRGSVPRLQPPHLQPLSSGWDRSRPRPRTHICGVCGGVEVHRLSRLQVGLPLGRL